MTEALTTLAPAPPSTRPPAVRARLELLEDVAEQHLSNGNDIDYVKARETSLYFFKESSPPSRDVLFEVARRAESLVAASNALAVKRTKEEQYATALSLLQTALGLTAPGCGLLSSDASARLQALTYNNLGCLERKRNNLSRAITHLTQAMRLEEAAFGCISPATGLNLSALLTKQGDTATALAVANKAVKAVVAKQKREMAPGRAPSEEHTIVLVSALHNLAVAREYSDDVAQVKKAYAAFTQAAAISEKELGPEHPTTRSIHASLTRYRSETAPSRGIVLATGSSVPAMPSITSSPGLCSLSSADCAMPAVGPSSQFYSTSPAVQLSHTAGPTKPPVSRSRAKRNKPPSSRNRRAQADWSTSSGSSKDMDSASGAFSNTFPAYTRPALGTPSDNSMPLHVHQQRPTEPRQPRVPDGRRQPSAGSSSAKNQAWLSLSQNGLERPTYTTPQPPDGAPAFGGSSKHAERMQARQLKDAARRQKEERQRMLAKRIYEREVKMKVKREQEAEREQREGMAKLMYERMCYGLRAEEMKRYRAAAKKVQKVWRGYCVRKEILRREFAAVTIQSVVRSHQSRTHQRNKRERMALDEAEAAALAARHKAARVIQTRSRYLHAARNLERIKTAKHLRRFYSARAIQREFRRYRASVRAANERKLEKQRLALVIQQRVAQAAAKRIQRWYRNRGPATDEEADDSAIIHASAALLLQRVGRGHLARELSADAAENQLRQEGSSEGRESEKGGAADEEETRRAVMTLQRAFRVELSGRQRKTKDILRQQRRHRQLLQRSARAIQRFYRSHVALAKARHLAADKAIQHSAAAVIQRNIRGYRSRQLAQSRRAIRPHEPAARTIQNAFRECLIRKKEKETEAYHARLKAERRACEKRTEAAMRIQAWARGNAGRRLAAGERAAAARRSAAAETAQRAWRCRAARKERAGLERLAVRVLREEARAKLRRRAACTVQRGTRCFFARRALAGRRLENLAAIFLQRAFKMFVAKRRLADLRRQRRDRIENAAARRIQRFARHALQKMELRRLEEYYNAKRLTKLRAQRRFEGALTLQCAWRGSRARKLYAVVKEVHVEKTAAAATIRRNWASYLLRKTMDKLSVARRAKYGRRRDASLLIQKFWRAVLAREYLQMLREDREIAEDAAIHLQCWWRQAEARRAAQRKREARRRQQTAARLDAIQLDVFVLLLQSCARTTAAQVDRRDRTVLKLKADIESKRRYTLGVRHGASLRIQSCYRGYLGRMYAKGVRREKREVALRENALKALQCDAACTIQRCVRTRQSRRKAAGMRADKAAAAAQEKEVMEASQEASDVVVQLFWEMEAMQGAAVVRETEAKKARRGQAARKIQCSVRCWLAVRQRNAMALAKLQEASALVIQEAWAVRRTVVHAARAERREEAAVVIQRTARLRAARRVANRMRRQHAERVEEALRQEEALDAFVVTAQSFWRRTAARQRAARLRLDNAAAKLKAAEHEGATIIQRTYRGHCGRLQAEKARRLRASMTKEEYNRKCFPANSAFANLGGPYAGQCKYSAKERDQAALKLQCCARRMLARRVANEKREAEHLRRAQQRADEEADCDLE